MPVASTELLRHIEALQPLGRPRGRSDFVFRGHRVGSVARELVGRLATMPGLCVDETQVRCPSQDVLDGVVATLRAEGTVYWRSEAFDILTDDLSVQLGTIDRGAIPVFGLCGRGAHLNGLVRDGSSWRLWVSRRAMTRPTEPGKLDQIAAGGVPAGHAPMQTLQREAWEEASIPIALSARCRPVSQLGYMVLRQEGLRRDVLSIFDLALPRSFEPRPGDGEVSDVQLWPIQRVVEHLRHTEEFKFNVAPVLLDLCLRLDALPAQEAAILRPALTHFRHSLI